MFDGDYNLILSKSGFKRLSDGPAEDGSDVAHEMLFSPEITIDQAGYVYIYLSNEEDSPWDVYFDDFMVEHVKSNVVQMNDYYPFGLKTSNSYAREHSVPNKTKLFQGQEHIDDLGLNWTLTGTEIMILLLEDSLTSIQWQVHFTIIHLMRSVKIK